MSKGGNHTTHTHHPPLQPQHQTQSLECRYSPAMYEKAQLLLSDRFLGFYLVPAPDGVWSYNFMGIKHSQGMDYALQVGNPKVRLVWICCGVVRALVVGRVWRFCGEFVGGLWRGFDGKNR